MAAVLQLGGLAAIVVGSFMLMPAAGVIVGGALMVLVGLAVERSKNAE
jgi:hypothetical protein